MDRAVDAFAHSDMAHQRIGRPENEDDNRAAWIKALATQMRLNEVYGVGEQVSLEGGAHGQPLQVLLAQELTTIFFLRDYIGIFAAHAQTEGHWRPALGRLALQGLLEGMQNRLPFTWSDRAAKVRRITGWTVTPVQPQGSVASAQAILDFWCYDMVALGDRLGRDEPGFASTFVRASSPSVRSCLRAAALDRCVSKQRPCGHQQSAQAGGRDALRRERKHGALRPTWRRPCRRGAFALH